MAKQSNPKYPSDLDTAIRVRAADKDVVDEIARETGLSQVDTIGMMIRHFKKSSLSNRATAMSDYFKVRKTLKERNRDALASKSNAGIAGRPSVRGQRRVGQSAGSDGPGQAPGQDRKPGDGQATEGPEAGQAVVGHAGGQAVVLRRPDGETLREFEAFGPR